MRIALATLAVGKQFKKTVKPGLDSKQEYCDLHDYDFVIGDEDVYDTDRPPAWSKINLVRKILGDYDVVFLSDADVVITNPLVRLENFVEQLLPEKKNAQLQYSYDMTTKRGGQTMGPYFSPIDVQEEQAQLNGQRELFCSSLPDKLVLLSRDNLNINTGNMFFKNDPKTMDLLEDIYAQTQFIEDLWWEQAAFIHLYNTKQHVRDITQLVGLRLFNAYEEVWHPGSFLIHFPATKHKLLEAKMRQYRLMARSFSDVMLQQLNDQFVGI